MAQGCDWTSLRLYGQNPHSTIKSDHKVTLWAKPVQHDKAEVRREAAEQDHDGTD